MFLIILLISWWYYREGDTTIFFFQIFLVILANIFYIHKWFPNDLKLKWVPDFVINSGILFWFLNRKFRNRFYYQLKQMLLNSYQYFQSNTTFLSKLRHIIIILSLWFQPYHCNTVIPNMFFDIYLRLHPIPLPQNKGILSYMNLQFTILTWENRDIMKYVFKSSKLTTI